MATRHHRVGLSLSLCKCLTVLLPTTVVGSKWGFLICRFRFLITVRARVEVSYCLGMSQSIRTIYSTFWKNKTEIIVVDDEYERMMLDFD